MPETTQNLANVCDPNSHKFAGIRFIFLDRDGVLNCKLPENQYATRWKDVKLLPGAAEALAKLNTDKRTVILVTNQRGIALGLLTEMELAQLHDDLCKELAKWGAHLDAIYYCPHDPQQNCHCRKPESGLFEQAFRDFPGASRDVSVVIGDSLSDIQAGGHLGMKTIFVEGEPSCRKPGSDRAAALADAVAESLKDAAERLICCSR
jgi:D-glycero-D-manno-heptose 1,7-bisphosphate phosphatase